MELSRKIQKLSTGEALNSLLSTYYRWRRPLNAKKMTEFLNSKGFERIRAKYQDPKDKKGWPKYVEAEERLELAIRQARSLHLDRCTGLGVLDIGSGAGYFLYVCKQLCHAVMGLDLDWPSMYGEMFQILQMPRKVWRIEPFRRLPDLGRRFDLITGFAVCFNSHGSDRVWGPKEWGFFLDDLTKNLLTPGGRIYFELNPEPWGYYTPDLADYFRSRGGIVEGKRITFRK